MKRSAQRRRLRRQRKSLSAKERLRLGALVAAQVVTHPWFRSASRIACYSAFDGELPVDMIIDKARAFKKAVYLPRLPGNGIMTFVKIGDCPLLKAHDHGFLQPKSGKGIDPRHLDLVLAPLVGFDGTGVRLGMGGGHYDRCFRFRAVRQQWRHPKLLGVGYDFQHQVSIDRERWDIPLDGAVTESRNWTF